MKGFVPREKMSKKQRKELDSAKRNEWSFSPVTRRMESKKVYNRKRKSDVRDEMRTADFIYFERMKKPRGAIRRAYFYFDKLEFCEQNTQDIMCLSQTTAFLALCRGFLN